MNGDGVNLVRTGTDGGQADAKPQDSNAEGAQTAEGCKDLNEGGQVCGI